VSSSSIEISTAREGTPSAVNRLAPDPHDLVIRKETSGASEPMPHQEDQEDQEV
jgi:hypothetical protein